VEGSPLRIPHFQHADVVESPGRSGRPAVKVRGLKSKPSI
jgi:hypothetical protein